MVEIDILTLDILARALSNCFNVSYKRAMFDADIILNIFGFEDTVVDNKISNQTRKFFYNLQDNGMLSVISIWYTLPYDKGNLWKTHYWHIEKKVISEYAINKKKRENLSSVQHFNIYDNLPDNVWNSRKIYSFI